MSTLMEDDIKRWTAKRKTALVLDIIQVNTVPGKPSAFPGICPKQESRQQPAFCMRIEYFQADK